MKTCTKCGDVKVLDAFYKHATSKGGVENCCKQCRMAQTGAYSRANREKMNTAKSTWAKANPDKVRSGNAAWRKANREKMKATEAAWKNVNPDKVKAKSAAWKNANPDKVKATLAAWARANRENLNATRADECATLAPSYIAAKLGIPIANLTTERLETKRMHLTIKRGVKAINNALREKKD